jgi:hypothetical protein
MSKALEFEIGYSPEESGQAVLGVGYSVFNSTSSSAANDYEYFYTGYTIGTRQLLHFNVELRTRNTD